jgi:hypothetical protein
MIEPWALKASVRQGIDPLNPTAPPATSAQLNSDKVHILLFFHVPSAFFCVLT